MIKIFNLFVPHFKLLEQLKHVTETDNDTAGKSFRKRGQTMILNRSVLFIINHFIVFFASQTKCETWSVSQTSGNVL